MTFWKISRDILSYLNAVYYNLFRTLKIFMEETLAINVAKLFKLESADEWQD